MAKQRTSRQKEQREAKRKEARAQNGKPAPVSDDMKAAPAAGGANGRLEEGLLRHRRLNPRRTAPSRVSRQRLSEAAAISTHEDSQPPRQASW
jgi:hypothetical protein